MVIDIGDCINPQAMDVFEHVGYSTSKLQLQF
jgi:hypothetical protein